MNRIKNENKSLKQDNQELEEEMNVKDQEAVQMKKSLDKIPKIKEKLAKQKEEITELQLKLKDERFEKNRVKDELKNTNLRELQDIASNLSQMLMQKKSTSFSEE